MATIGKLSVILTANGEALTKGLGQASKSIEKFKKAAGGEQASKALGGAEGMGGMAAGAGAVAAGIAVAVAAGAAFSAWVGESISSTAEFARQAEELGVSLQGLAGIQIAAGPAAEGLGTAMNHFSRELFALEHGSSEAAQKFSQFGLTAASFAGLNLEGAFGKVADTVAAIGDPTQRAALAFALMGREGREMIGVLSKGSFAFAEGAQKARLFGTALSTEEASSVEKAAASMRELQSVVTGAGRSFAVALSPFVTDAAGVITDWVEHAGGVRPMVADIVDAFASGLPPAIESLMVLADVLTLVRNNLGSLMELEVRTSTLGLFGAKDLQALTGVGLDAQQQKKIDDMMAKIRAATDALRHPLAKGGGPPAADPFIGGIQQLAKKLEEQGATFGMSAAQIEIWRMRMQGATEAQLNGLVVLEKHNRAVEELVNGVSSGFNVYGVFADKLSRLNDLFPEGARQAADYQAAVAKLQEELRKSENSRAAELFKGSRTGLEKFRSELFELRGLFVKGLLDADTFGRGLAEAFDQAEASLGGGGSKAPEAVLQNSKEALSLIAANQRDQDRNDPQKRVEAVLKEIKEKHEKQLDWEKRIATAVEKLTGLKQVKF
jgi:hypothetical protein